MYKLLIADDEHLECDAIELLVTRANLPLQCFKAKNGHEAIKIAKLQNPEIIFLDIKMPGLDGIETAKQIRAINEDCQIVFLTAWSTFELAQQAIRLGASEYLVKPVKSKDVYNLLDKLILNINKEKTLQKQQAGDIREVLNLFSREFFISLKYGRLSEEAMNTYFRMQEISLTTGFTLVISGKNEEALHKIFLCNKNHPKVQLCYFPAVDRTTVLVFSIQETKIIEQLTKHPEKREIFIGEGTVFTDLTGIPKSISTASIAHTHACKHKIQFQKYSDELKPLIDTSKLQKKNITMIEHTLNGNVEKARNMAHEIIDTVRTKHTQENDAIEELYELLMMFSYEVNKNIAFLNHPKPQKSPIMSQEIYLLDLIDLACSAILEDKKNHYSRPFTFIDQYLRTHYHDQISVDQIAKMIGLNTKYFTHLCKIYLGTTFVEYLTNIRMEKAKHLLTAGEHSIKEVAKMTGFSDRNYFARVFKQTFCITPSDFKEDKTFLC